MERFRFMSRGMAAVLILSIIIAFMISLIPNMKLMDMNKDLPVFRQQKQVYITENNIVDFVVSFPLEMQIKRVSFKYNTLSFDFALKQDMDTGRVYQDIYTVVRKSLLQGTHVKEVLVRIFVKDTDKIFVAVSANKKDIEKNPTMELGPTMQYKDFLNKYFGLNYGNIIKQD